ncbi:MAG: pyridoxamine 5'-phosphate oxidase family protein [Lachnospiraceae bacterium]|nr:pyridoxamine 5'-phosphate oxidase family protein [Lachnospiraceae bacterium]
MYLSTTYIELRYMSSVFSKMFFGERSCLIKSEIMIELLHDIPLYRNDPRACIYFYHKGLIKYTGVMLKGKMEVLTDQETKEMIWRKGDTIFYKGGVTDPDYCVLKFTAESGRYYCDLKTESFRV